MINLYPWPKVVATIAVIYAAIIILIGIFLSFFAIDGFKVLSIAISGGTLLQFFLYSLVYFLWERLWIKFPVLNKWIFPNLNGTWSMSITWSDIDKKNTASATALIKQNLLSISIEVEAPDSHSVTILAVPKKDSASQTPGIYYIYKVIPDTTKFHDRPEYFGTAFLRYTSTGFDQLKGNYFTERKSVGRFEMLKLFNTQ